MSATTGAGAVDMRPYCYSVESATQAFGLSKWRIRQLIRDEKIAVRYDGAKLLILGDSLRRWFDSLPSERQQ